jgi:Bacterial cell division membrane protein
MGNTTHKRLDWVIVACYLFLIIFGWMNIYSSSAGEGYPIFDFSTKHGMHLIWMATAIIIAILILYVLPSKLYNAFAWWLYIFILLALIAVTFVGVEVNGSKSWFAIGPFRLQPAEFSKITTSLALATMMSRYEYNFKKPNDLVKTFLILFIPMVAIVMEKETGSALVYLGFLLMFYREGMTGWVLVSGLVAILLFILTLILSPFASMLILLGIILILALPKFRNWIFWLAGGAVLITLLAFLPRLGRIEALAPTFSKFAPEVWHVLVTMPFALFFGIRALLRRNTLIRNICASFILGVVLIFSVNFIFNNVLQDHQRLRIESLLGITDDPMGVGYNVHQSMIAIGSGGFVGKGFLHGTQTRFDFVPEQSTDFIFCTVGEEWGFIGALVVIIIYLTLIIRIFNSAERQKDAFARIYGYCVACCFLMHVFINISMTIGLMPVIGIPLPFMSYGGSSLWAFTILLSIFLRLDMEN